MSHRKAVTFDLDAVASHLRAIHPVKTAEHVGAAIGFPPETVRQWLRGASRPNGGAALALVGVYGPELLAAALPDAPGWLRRALVAERRRTAMDEMRRWGERLGAVNDEPEIEGPEPSRLGRVVGRRFRGDLRALRSGVGDAAGG
jgi:hypothetical protein